MYLSNRNQIVKEVHKIYSNEIPEFLYKYLDIPEVARLNQIGQHCGLDYVNIKNIKPKFFYSRLDHSLGVALILWNFTKSKRETLAGLFHDISSPTFAHVVDFLYGDHANQEHTEKETKSVLEGSEQIIQCLKYENISIDDVCDYKIYPIADNILPKLSSDRLEYTFILQLIYNGWDLKKVEEIYNNLTIYKNENDQDEIGFKSYDIANIFTLGALQNGIKVSSDEDTFAMKFLSDILKLAIEVHEISEQDLYSFGEKQIITKLQNSSNAKIKEAWDFYTKLNYVNISSNPIEDKYCINLNVKKRYINPLVNINNKVLRVGQISSYIENEINNFINNDSGMYVYADFNFENTI